MADDEPAGLGSDSDPVESMGPIQMMSIAFDGNHFKGEILPELERLKREKIVRIIDMLFVRKDSLGGVSVTTATDLDWEEAVSFGSFVGALSGFAAEDPRGSTGERSRARPNSQTGTCSTRTTSSASPRRCRRTCRRRSSCSSTFGRGPCSRGSPVQVA